MARTVVITAAISIFVGLTACTSSKKMVMIMGSNPLEGDEKAAVYGKQVYQIHCQSCHGSDHKGQGTASVGLTNPPADLNEVAAKKSVKTIAANISYGKGSEMPAFKDTLSEKEIWQAAMYLKSIAASK